MNKIYRFAGLSLLCLTVACGGAEEEDPTFSEIYDEIFVASGCTAAPLCHGNDQGKLTMRDRDGAYAALVNVKAMGMNIPDNGTAHCADTGLTRVVPGDPDNSLLVQKIEQVTPACGSRMPIGTPLIDDQMEKVRNWIAAGAKND